MARLTLDQFIEQLKPCENLGAAVDCDFEPTDYQPGFLFDGSYWIADSYTDDGALADGKGGTLPRYWTIVERGEYWDDELRVVAKPLWEFVMEQESYSPRVRDQRRLELQRRMVAFISAGYALLESWYVVENAGGEVPVEGYPFAESFEEVLANLSRYREQIDRWAVEEREPDGGSNQGTQEAGDEARHEAGAEAQP